MSKVLECRLDFLIKRARLSLMEELEDSMR